jgi:AbiJ N-terminal domain 3/Abortive infection C-terminus
MDISEVTRRNLFDELSLTNVSWSGRLEEPAFLERVFDLSRLSSNDPRFRGAARDIWQHRVNNFDWSNDWIFTDTRFNLLRADDQVLLRFLCEMLHPVVRPDDAEVETLKQLVNRHLRQDGWELFEQTTISGRPVFAARRLLEDAAPAIEPLKEIAVEIDAAYLSQQVTRMESALTGDTELVIGTAKELVETVCKTILHDFSVEPDKDWDLPRLVRETMGKLSLLPVQVDAAVAGARSLRMVLQSLATTVQGLSELRNPYGTGHGKAADSRGLELRHGRLAVRMAAALATFLYESRPTDA